MKIITPLLITVLLVSGFAAGSYGSELPEVEGVFGLNRITSQTYLAIWVPVENGAVVTGLRWFHNDGTTSFPEILAHAGLLDWPSDISNAVSLMQDVGGQTSAWSEVHFPQPITADSSGLYIYLHLQEGAVFLNEGAGGGFGLGHYAGDGVRSCWLTGDGIDWNPMDSNHQMAVEPIVASDKAVGDALVLKLFGGADVQQESPRANNIAALIAYPNPFNPQTEINYVVPRPGLVKLGIYDLRGRLVRELVGGNVEAGEYSVTWDGCSSGGQMVASGAYFARFKTRDVALSKQLVLLK